MALGEVDEVVRGDVSPRGDVVWLVLMLVWSAAVRDDTALAFSPSRRFFSASRSCASFSACSLRFSYSVNKSNRSIAVFLVYV